MNTKKLKAFFPKKAQVKRRAVKVRANKFVTKKGKYFIESLNLEINKLFDNKQFQDDMSKAVSDLLLSGKHIFEH